MRQAVLNSAVDLWVKVRPEGRALEWTVPCFPPGVGIGAPQATAAGRRLCGCSDGGWHSTRLFHDSVPAFLPLFATCSPAAFSLLLVLVLSSFNYREQVRVSSSHPWDLLNYVETSGPWYFCLSRPGLNGLRTSRSLFTCYFLRSSEFSHPVSYVALEIERIVNFRSLTQIKTTNPGLIYRFLGKIFSDTPPFLKWVPVIDLLLAVCLFPQNHFLSSCEHAL